MRRLAIVISTALALACLAAATPRALDQLRPRWTPEEREMLRSLSLSSVEPLPADPSNRYGDDPRAAELGRALFFDTRLSGNGRVSCATCHVPSQGFQDGKPFGEGVGTTGRRTPPIAGTARNAWFFWDGRADSQWAQALGPLESAVEHGGSRTQYAHLVARHYRERYEAVFGALPDLSQLPAKAGPVADTAVRAAWERIPAARRDEVSRVYANIGKAIAAYERRLEPGPSRFDRYVDDELAGRPHTAASTFTPDEEAGLRVFIGKGDCTTCHDGAMLTDNHFHNIGVPLPARALPPDSGRITGVRQAIAAEFACTGRYSDAGPDDCAELRFAETGSPDLVRAYKTPSLRNVAERAPWMHAGQLGTLADVVAHYDRAPASIFGHSELKPLHLTPDERRQLEAFLRTLSGPVVAPAGWLDAPVARR